MKTTAEIRSAPRPRFAPDDIVTLTMSYEVAQQLRSVSGGVPGQSHTRTAMDTIYGALRDAEVEYPKPQPRVHVTITAR